MSRHISCLSPVYGLSIPYLMILFNNWLKWIIEILSKDHYLILSILHQFFDKNHQVITTQSKFFSNVTDTNIIGAYVIKKYKNTVLWMKQGLVSPCIRKWFFILFLSLKYVSIVNLNKFKFFDERKRYNDLYHTHEALWISHDLCLYKRLMSLSLLEIMLGRFSFFRLKLLIWETISISAKTNT